MRYCLLPDRGVVAISGPDAREFLQGLVSNDVDKISAERAVYAALLTPQGKYLFDFFMTEIGGTLHLDCERARIGDLMKRLRIYKLRAQAEVADVSDAFAVAALWGDDAAAAAGLGGDEGAAQEDDGGSLFVDPRLAETGLRAILPAAGTAARLAGLGGEESNAEDYDRHRLKLGLPDGSRDLVVDKSLLMESGFDELNGIDWRKGCYMGQELTARTRYRGLVKKRLVPVEIEGPEPEPGSEIRSGDKAAGEIRSSAGGRGLALIRLEYVKEALPGPLVAAGAHLTPVLPDWVRLTPET